MRSSFCKCFFVIFSLIICALFLPSCTSSSNKGNAPVILQKKRVSPSNFALHGFKLIEQKHLDMVDGTAYILQHIKSGAKVFYVDTDDTHRAFSISVSTPPQNNKGTAHVLERMLLQSTKKYSGKSLKDIVASTTINTSLTSATAASYVQFPFSTTNEAQFMALADYYMSAVFTPDLNANLFAKEGVRETLTSSSSTIFYDGNTYSAQKIAENNMLVALDNLMQESLFADTNMRFNALGTSQDMPNLTFEELVDYHQKYFVPSNAIIGVYGALDCDAVLKFLNEEYLCKFDATTNLAQIAPQTPFAKERYLYRTFATSNKTQKSNGTIIAKGYALSNLQESDFTLLLFALRVLNNANSYLMQTLKQSGIGDNYFLRLNLATRQPQVEIVGENIASSKSTTFARLINDALTNIVANGIDDDLFDTIKSDFAAVGLLARENVNIGRELITNMAAGEIALGNKYAIANANYDAVNIDKNAMQQWIKKYLLDNRHSSLVILEPKAGLLEENEKALNDKLVEKTLALSNKEARTLIEKSAQFTEWLHAKDDSGMQSARRIAVVSQENFETFTDSVKITEQTRDGVRYIFAPITSKAMRTTLLLNSAHLSMQDLQYAKLYASIIGCLPANNLTEAEVDASLCRNVLGIKSSVETLFTDATCSIKYPALCISWYSEQKKWTNAENLIKNILFNTVLEPNRLKMLIALEKQALERNMQANNARYVASRAHASVDDTYSLDDFLHGEAYYKFIVDVYNEAMKNPSPVIEKILAMRTNLLVNNGATVIVQASRSSFNLQAGSIITDAFATLVDKNDGAQNDVMAKNGALQSGAQADATNGAKRVAFVKKGSTNYLASAQCINATQKVAYAIAADLLTSGYFAKSARESATGQEIEAGLQNNTFLCVSARDPSIDRTLELFAGAKNYIVADDAFEKTLVNRYAKETYPVGLFTRAYNTALNYVQGITNEQNAFLSQFATVTKQDVQNAIQNLVDIGTNQYTVFTSAPAIKASTANFDVIIGD